MKASQIFPDYLRKEDLPEPKRVTISRVAIEKVQTDHGKEKMPVIHFTDKELNPYVLNKTNARICQVLFGDEISNWRGQEIEVYCEPFVFYEDEQVGGIRFRAPGSVDAKTDKAVWSFEEALRRAAEVNIGREQIKAALSAMDRKGYRQARDTEVVQALINAALVGVEPTIEDLQEVPL